MSLVESEEEIMRSVLQCLLILIILAQAGASGAAPLTPISGFWKNWGDGNAEIAVYELSTMRYGEERKGYAVAIVVTEPWNLTKNVKSDRNKGRDIIPALKLNLIRNFQTGVYDYHTMTSAFVALQRGPQVPAHGALKLSFSAQEWCGHTFESIRFHPEKSVSLHHSYFESSPKAHKSFHRCRARTISGSGPEAFKTTPYPRSSYGRVTMPEFTTKRSNRSNSV